MFDRSILTTKSIQFLFAWLFERIEPQPKTTGEHSFLSHSVSYIRENYQTELNPKKKNMNEMDKITLVVCIQINNEHECCMHFYFIWLFVNSNWLFFCVRDTLSGVGLAGCACEVKPLYVQRIIIYLNNAARPVSRVYTHFLYLNVVFDRWNRFRFWYMVFALS